MAAQLPLLVFPKATVIVPDLGRGFPSSLPHLPSRKRQVARLETQLDDLQHSFFDYQATIGDRIAGMEPETVLVMEIVGGVDDFKQAIEAAGLEWLGEWDIDDIEPDDEFYEIDSKKNRKEKLLNGRLFLSISNEAGLRELLSLWEQWSEEKELPRGKTKWRDVFNQLKVIRRWGIRETLFETGMAERWKEMLSDPFEPEQPVTFQIELFYRKNEAKRIQNEKAIAQLLQECGGRLLSAFINMPEIAFHAVKAELPLKNIRQLLDAEGELGDETDIQLFKFPGVMYFRPTGQSLVSIGFSEGEPSEFSYKPAELPPVAALLDGAPLLMHEALKDRLQFDDLFDVESLYQIGDRKHGTAMASLIALGDGGQGFSQPLSRKIYCVPVMQPDPKSPRRDEHIPDDVFFEDRIHVAVKRMFEGSNGEGGSAPRVKIVNLSICDPERPFIHTPSPWARLLDWLSWKYRVLFCVSAGNSSDAIDLGLSYEDFMALPDDQKLSILIGAIAQSLSSRRLLSPAESMNALTIGALHADEAGDYPNAHGRVDLMSDASLFSPAMRFGHGFRRSVKPELLFPGGRQLYREPLQRNSSVCVIDSSKGSPGQKVASDSVAPGVVSNTIYTRGTSNATALATRGAARVYDMLEALDEYEKGLIPDSMIAILIKGLLVHAAKQTDILKDHITAALRTSRNSRQFKQIITRYIGYGEADIDRVLSCTEQRATVLGHGEISEDEVHEYVFPLPFGLASQKLWRRLVITLAWFTPINPDHRNLREAKLEFEPGGMNWENTPLKVKRQDADYNQVQRGTVQHEVFEAANEISAYQENENIRIRVLCKKDATTRLDVRIPYGLAVTLEVKEDVEIPIYQQVRDRIKPQVGVAV